MVINAQASFIMYALCEVDYVGRACSHLSLGRYLIIRKNDGSLLIHNGLGNPPQNYQGSKATLEVDGNNITSSRKKETIKIKLHEVFMYEELKEWSENEVEVKNTEKDLVNRIIDNWNEILKIPIKTIIREFPTKHGPIDIVGITDVGMHVIVEVKRGKASLNNCSQVNRYYEHFVEHGIDCMVKLASPSIGSNALSYLKKHGFEWIQVRFD